MQAETLNCPMCGAAAAPDDPLAIIAVPVGNGRVHLFRMMFRAANTARAADPLPDCALPPICPHLNVHGV